MRNFHSFISYVKDYGKPRAGQPLNIAGIIVALAVIVFLTLLAFRFGVWYLSLLLLGEYKSNYECFLAYCERRK